MFATNPYFRPLLGPTLFLLAGLPVLVWLGVWQLQRLEWKQGIIAQMEARLGAAAIELDGQVLAPEDEYRRYKVSGTFLPDTEFHWLTTSDAYGVGYQLYAPFRLNDGRLVMVNRGYIPAALKDPASRTALPGSVSFEALARMPETPGSLDAENDLVSNIWFTRDITAMCAQAGVGACLPLYLQQEGEVAEEIWPKPGAARVTVINNHLDYALTWFGLAIVLIAVYLAFHKGQGRIGYPRNSGDKL